MNTKTITMFCEFTNEQYAQMFRSDNFGILIAPE